MYTGAGWLIRASMALALEVSITAPGSLPLSAYRQFLYATVGDDKNGMMLTLLSALARQNVDPWQEAADLSKLPRDSAMQQIILRLKTLSGDTSLADRTALVERLMPLLPSPAPIPEAPGGFFNQLHAGIKRICSSELPLVIIYLILMSAGGWIFASSEQPAVSAQNAQQVLAR